MKTNPFEVVDMFEKALAEFTGAPYVVTTTSCTEALFLCLKYFKNEGLYPETNKITIPARTYVSVPQSILQAGYDLGFEDIKWEGVYQLKPLEVYDAAKRLKKDMYIPRSIMCLSFHHKKLLKIGKGGCLLLDSKSDAEALKRLRYEGRTQQIPYHEDIILRGGYNMYMTPEQAARGLTLLWDHPEDSPDLVENPPYRDLRTFEFVKQNAS